ncbi:MAG: Gfo/Idh/MocA family oxidoreductase [Verrucomicrobia bacterium]|jgi:predicted dehydrogenase|nr:Gfo/Idh/MocA family oxidoreductase [Verrucomicrobiota bacterium]
MSSKGSEVRMGLVGLGNMGTAHATCILEGKVPGLRLTAVCDVDEVVFKKLDKHRDKLELFTDASALIASGKIDAIVIATPHFAHTTIGIEALQAGLHVLVEKPISVHKADCERLIAAHQSDGQIFGAMFNQRTDPHYQRLRQLITSGELGKINRVNWIITNWFRSEAYYASGGWRATWKGEGGGVLLNQCPHQLDLWQWLFGMPNTVRAFCSIGKYHDVEVEDEVTAYMEYADGATGVFITTTGEAPGTNRLEVAAERGRVVIEDGTISFTRNEVETSVFSNATSEAFATPPIWKIEIPVQGNGEQHLGILKNFAAALLDDKPLLADAREGIHSVELGNAMLYSSMTGETVDMPLDGAAYEGLLNKLIAESTVEKKVRSDVTANMDSSF